MRCERCGNRIKELFLKRENGYVCRKCLMYKNNSPLRANFSHNYEYKLNYKLTKQQEEASGFVLRMVKEQKNCILQAVTGAGKTEIVYETISYCIKSNLRIGIVIPRKDVVIELEERIKKAFSKSIVAGVYGGNTFNLCGDIIILTSHQLYRYPNYFDVLIIDEVDAFPFYKNEILENFLLHSVKGCIVYMSATIPTDILKKGYPLFKLNKRYHHELLDIPKVRYFFFYGQIKRFILRNKEGVNLIYFPTIKLEEKWDKKLKLKHYVLNSKISNRKELLQELHNQTSAIVLTTLVLERGVTFQNSNVLVYLADHKLFTFENLVQIAGRVGRSKDYPHGEIIFLVNHKNKKVKKAIRFIKECNE